MTDHPRDHTPDGRDHNRDDDFGTAGHPRRWWILAVLCLSLTLEMVSNSSKNVALPSIAADLDASASQLQWVVDAYALVFAGMLFAGATLGDRFGRKGALQAGLGLFVVAALAGAFVDDATQLIAVRAVMGFGAAFVMPSTLSILTNVFPARERPRAIAMWAGISAAGGALGPPISGLLLQHFWWGSVLLVTLPVSGSALLIGRVIVPKSKDPHGTRLDIVGVVLSIVAIVALVYTVIEAPHHGWLSVPTLGGLALAAVMLVVFVVVERWRAQPMLDIGLFRDRRFSVASAVIGLGFFAMFGHFFLLSQVFQMGHGMSPLRAGLMMVPLSVVMAVVAPRAAVITERLGVRGSVPLGLAMLSTGLLLFGVFSRFGSPYLLLISGCLLSAGMSITGTPLTSLMMATVPRERAGMGSAMNNATREMGGALGVAVIGSVVNTVYISRLGDLTGYASDLVTTARSGVAGALQAAESGAPGAAALADQAVDAFLDGVLVAGVIAACMAAVAGVISRAFLPRTELLAGSAEDRDLAAELAAANSIAAEG